MYAWHQVVPTETRLKTWLMEQLKIEFAGLGLYLTDKDTILVTVEDSDGERAVGGSQADCRFNVYVFNVPFAKTIFAQRMPVQFDERTTK